MAEWGKRCHLPGRDKVSLCEKWKQNVPSCCGVLGLSGANVSMAFLFWWRYQSRCCCTKDWYELCCSGTSRQGEGFWVCEENFHELQGQSSTITGTLLAQFFYPLALSNFSLCKDTTPAVTRTHPIDDSSYLSYGLGRGTRGRGLFSFLFLNATETLKLW